MSRELRITIAVMVVVLIAASPLIFADVPAQPTTSYLAMVFHIVPTPTPSPIPTPTPPDISTLVIQLHEMRSAYTLSEYHVATNADAAKAYHNPKAAAAAFLAQGRETSWYGEYGTAAYARSDALVVSSQVYRYLTPAGAAAGMQYTVDETRLDSPGFSTLALIPPDCCPTIALQRIFNQSGLTVHDFFIISQVGRYVVATRSVGLIAYYGHTRAIYYANLGLDHVTPVPQAMQAGELPLPAGEPQTDTIDAAIRPH